MAQTTDLITNFSCCHLQGRNEGGQGGHVVPGAEPLRGAESLTGRRRDPKTSQKLSSIQQICFVKTLCPNMGAPNLFLARAPSNLGTPLVTSEKIPFKCWSNGVLKTRKV